MSGIFAFAGSIPCRDLILDGINGLKRRGNDLCGTAIRGNGIITLFKIQGSPDTLLSKAESIKNAGYTGLAECKNACRAKPSAITSVPCASEKLAVAVDGNIENFDELKRRLKVSFPIATGEDLLLALMSVHGEENILKRLNAVISEVDGNPTAVIITADEDAVYCRAGSAPLTVGIYESGCSVASEIQALTNGAKRYFTIESGECARITKERAVVYDERLKRVKKPLLPLPEIKIYENDFSLDNEVFCLPVAVKDTLSALIKNGELTLGGYQPSHRNIDKLSGIILTGSGDSYRAAMLGAAGLEQLCDIPCRVYPSGDLRLSPAVFSRSTLLIAVSPRGEDENTIACVKRAQAFGAKTLAVTGAPYSYLARICDDTINTNSDFSNGDICLRSFISGALALSLLALKIGFECEIISNIYLNVSLKMAEMLPGKISGAVKNSAGINALSEIFKSSENLIFCGVCADYAVSAEAAHKVRSVLNLNAIAFNLAEMENESDEYLKNSNVIAVITSGETLQKALTYLRRLRIRGAAVTIITSANLEEEISDFEGVIPFSDSIPLFNWAGAISCIYKAAAEAALSRDESTAQKAI